MSDLEIVLRKLSTDMFPDCLIESLFVRLGNGFLGSVKSRVVLRA